MDEPTRILVERARDGDLSAAGGLFERYRTRLRRALGRMVAPAATTLSLDTEDVLQDATLAALHGIGRFEYRGEGSFLAWLLQTAKRELLHRVRAAHAQKRRGNRVSWSVAGEPQSPDASPSQLAIRGELEVRVQAAIERLPERERSALLLARYLDASTAEMQAELGLPTPGAARALLSRAQARLMRLLDDEPPPQRARERRE